MHHAFKDFKKVEKQTNKVIKMVSYDRGGEMAYSLNEVINGTFTKMGQKGGPLAWFFKESIVPQCSMPSNAYENSAKKLYA